MTVSYQYEVASSTSGGFTRLLFMWRGSLYKLIYRELLLFLVAFGCLSALYRNAFSKEQKKLFEKVVMYCDTFINLIPLSFVLGFYVAYVAARWWQQYIAIPWPDNSAVKRRFPTMEHLVEAGFITPVELALFQSVPSKEFNTYWIPCSWFICLLKQTRKTNRITDTQGLKLIVEEFNEFRSKCGLLWSFDWISIPLVYTQVVTLATYSFFLAALVGRQYVDDAKKLQMEIDRYIPVFTILQFFFFMGLLKVAEQLINPFGDDDEDFELNWLIDRHTKVSYLGVDTLMSRCPPLVKDKYFDDVDVSLPYTGAAFAYKKKTYRGSVHDMQVPEEQQSMFLPEIIEEDEDEQSTKRSSPKNSLGNIHNEQKKGNDSHTAAGIWRMDSLSLLHHTPCMEENMQQYMEMGIGPDTDIHEEASPPTHSDLFIWPSNSTLESFSSTAGFTMEDTSEHAAVINENQDTELNCRQERENSNDVQPVRVQRSISSVFSKSSKAQNLGKYNSVGDIGPKHSSSKETLNETSMRKLQKLLTRRQSSSSGQWKGVRWKPVLDHSGGDSWSDNAARKDIARHRHLATHCSHCLCSDRATPARPAASSPTLVQLPIPSGSGDYNTATLASTRVEAVGMSLPNIPVLFTNNLTIPQCSSSLRTIPSFPPHPPVPNVKSEPTKNNNYDSNNDNNPSS